jgi:hypothetical protein
MGAAILLTLIAVPGWLAVIGLARCLTIIPGARRWALKYRLLASHTGIVTALMAYSPISIRANWGSPYGDVYGPFLLVPGFPVYYPAARLSDPAFAPLLRHMESFPASVITVIVLPGLLSILLGGVIWFTAGIIWGRAGPKSAEPFAP